MTRDQALDVLDSHSEKPLTTHEMAKALLALPDTVMQLLDKQGGRESVSPQLDPEVCVQVSVRTW